MIEIYPLLVFVTAVGGFFLANHIRAKKKVVEHPFVCPLNFDCHSVVNSQYSRFLGVSLEKWGMLYYGTIAVVYATFIANPALRSTQVVYAAMGLSLLAFVISLYLTAVQAFQLRTWCSLCLASAALCTLIFSFAWLGV